MIPRSPLAAIVSAFLLASCSNEKGAVAGGDDMGNFLRAELLDSTGTPLEGRIHASSNVDTFSLVLDEGGILTLPARRREWIAMRTPSGSAFLLHSPPDSGTLSSMRLGTPRPLVGWLQRAATFGIAGVGTTSSAGGLFRFAEVPPGFMVLKAWSDSFTASALLSTDSPDQAHGARIDSFVVAPLAVAGTRLVTAERDDTIACGSRCRWIWTDANVVVGQEAIPQTRMVVDTFRLAVFSSGAIPDTGGILAIDSVRDLGNWLLLWIRMHDPGANPLFLRAEGDSVPGDKVPHRLVLGSGPIVDTARLPGADTTRLRRVAVPRPVGTVFADSIVIQWMTTRTVAPSSRSASTDVCDAMDTNRARPCGAASPWFFSP